MDFDEDDLKEIMGIVTVLYEPVKKMLGDLVTDMKDPKWAKMTAVSHAAYYKTLKENGFSDTFARAMTKLHVVNAKFLYANLPDLSNILSKREKKEVS